MDRAPRTLLGLAALVLAATAAPAASRAQAAPSSDYWSFYLIPFPSYNALEGLGASLSGGWRKASPPGPVPVGISIEPNAIISTSGTRGAQLVFDEEGRWHGWRLLLMAGSVREQRAPYFGLGNRSAVADSLDSRYGKAYSTYSLLRTTGLVAVRRQLAGPLHLLVGAQFRHYRALPLAGRRSKLADDLAAGVPLDTGATDGLEVRGGLLFDTRDEESSPSKGVFVEALVARGLKGGLGRLDYTRYALGMREFVPITEFTSLAFRQNVEISRGAIPFYVADERMTSWRPEDGFGGVTTLRASLPGRFSAPNKALLSADLRYRNWDFLVTPTTPVRLWFLVFADVGRVWISGETFASDHLHAGGGVGALLQIGRGTFFGFDVGWSPDAHVSFTTALSLAY
ncbi:MAG: BamA/TamA family outer membrane protein [Gemmatimonadales bacterium]